MSAKNPSHGWTCCRHYQAELGSSGTRPPRVGGLICLGPRWAAGLKKKKKKKKCGAKNRKKKRRTMMHSPPRHSFCGFLWSLFGQWSPPTRRFVFPPLQEKPDPRGVSLHFSSHTRYKQATRRAWVRWTSVVHMFGSNQLTPRLSFSTVGAVQGAETWLSEWQALCMYVCKCGGGCF